MQRSSVFSQLLVASLFFATVILLYRVCRVLRNREFGIRNSRPLKVLQSRWSTWKVLEINYHFFVLTDIISEGWYIVCQNLELRIKNMFWGHPFVGYLSIKYCSYISAVLLTLVYVTLTLEVLFLGSNFGAWRTQFGSLKSLNFWALTAL